MQIKPRRKTLVQHAYFFGYRSLVNRAAHAFKDAHPAHLSGSRPVWHHTHLRPVAYRTVVLDEGAEIDGLIVLVSGENWRVPNARGAAYMRASATHQVCHFQKEIKCFGILRLPALKRQPEGNGATERAIRTLKEQLLWVRDLETVEKLRRALAAFADEHNASWLRQRHGHKTPADQGRTESP